MSRAELLENCRVIAGATDLPVNADLENGYADDPKEAATILRDAAAGRRSRGTSFGAHGVSKGKEVPRLRSAPLGTTGG